MIRRAALMLLVPTLAYGAILPDSIGDWKRGEVTPANAPAPHAKVWAEYGLQEAETAQFIGPASPRPISISAYRFSDSTGAFGAWDSIRPAAAHKIESDGLGAEAGDEQFIAVGNFLFVFHSFKPDHDQLAHLYLTAPHYSNAQLPPLQKYLPPGANPNSERYIGGPEALAKYAPAISPSTAAFHFSTEALLADYGKTTIVVFNFPGVEMAQKQLSAFEQIPGAVVKRTGPLVAVALHPASPDVAERLLAPVKYEAEVTLAEKPPTLKDNPGNLFLNIAILCGVLIAFAVASGLVFGGIRHLWRRNNPTAEGDEMISLHLSERR